MPVPVAARTARKPSSGWALATEFLGILVAGALAKGERLNLCKTAGHQVAQMQRHGGRLLDVGQHGVICPRISTPLPRNVGGVDLRLSRPKVANARTWWREFGWRPRWRALYRRARTSRCRARWHRREVCRRWLAGRCGPVP